MLRVLPPVALLALLLGACSDQPVVTPDPDPPEAAPGAAVLVQCRVDVGAEEMRCAPAVPAPTGASADLIMGGQGILVLLANGEVTVGGGVLSTPVTVQNLTVQALGTADGTTVSPRGVRVFFHQGPTNGVTIDNADGVGMYTGAGQPYFEYPGILQPQQVSASRTWSFVLNGATSFSFSVYVVAEVPSETGILRFRQVAGENRWSRPGVWTTGSTIIVVEGYVFRSTDRGATWTKRTGPVSLTSVWGAGSTVVTVGAGGTILRSTDTGRTWSAVESGTTQTLRSVWGEGSNFVAVGSGGTILRSVNGGASWSAKASTLTNDFLDVFGSGSTVVAVSSTGTYRSTNGGSIWRRQNLVARSVWGEDTTFVTIGGSGTHYSRDGGATWSEATVWNGSHASFQAVSGSGSTLVAVGDRREVFRSTDAGANWRRVNLTLPYSYHNRFEPDLSSVVSEGSTVTAVGTSGTFLRSTNGGATWSVSWLRHHTAVWGDGSTFVAVGRHGMIRRSTDSGTTWSDVPHGAGFTDFRGVWGNGSTVVVVGYGAILRSTDGGATWTTVPGPHGDLFAVSGAGSTIVAVGSSRIFRSTDSGVTWSEVPSGTTHWLFDVWGEGSTFLAVGSNDLILRSTDAGATWTVISLGAPFHATLYAVWGEGAAVVAVGEEAAIRRSVDGGATWVTVGGIPLLPHESYFEDVTGAGSTLLAVSRSGPMIRSTNGGSTWHVLESGSDEIAALWMNDAQSAIAVGSHGLILRGMR